MYFSNKINDFYNLFLILKFANKIFLKVIISADLLFQKAFIMMENHMYFFCSLPMTTTIHYFSFCINKYYNIFISVSS